MTSRETPRPTLEAVAARAGVGRGTVSRVINGSPKVSAKARAAVLAAVDELGYVPNRAARSLVTRRTDTVALVISESQERLWGEPYFAGLIRGIGAELSGSGRQLLLALAQSAEEHDRLDRYLTGQHVDGVLLASLHGDDPLPAHLESRGVPTVLCGVPTGIEPVSFVDADNAGGARQAVRHLMRTGRRRIGVIAGPQDMRVGVDRLRGCAEAATELVAFGDFSEASGAAAMRTLLDGSSGKGPGGQAIDAVFAHSDPMAVGAMRVLRERGRRIPEDVAVIGFDDSAIAAHAEPPLTTVHQPVEEMGREMARILVARITGEPPGRLMETLPTRLVIRASA